MEAAGEHQKDVTGIHLRKNNFILITGPLGRVVQV
jgi:hypothetical protein